MTLRSPFFYCGFFLAVLICSGTLNAQNPMDYFAGEWSLGVWQAGNHTPQADIRAQWKAEHGLDAAFCLTGRVTTDNGIFTRELMAFDPSGKAYTRTIAANDGSCFVLTTKGWDGEHLTWTGTRYGKDGPVRIKEEITRQDGNAFEAVFYSAVGEQWILLQTERLKRVR